MQVKLRENLKIQKLQIKVHINQKLKAILQLVCAGTTCKVAARLYLMLVSFLLANSKRQSLVFTIVNFNGVQCGLPSSQLKHQMFTWWFC